MVMFLLCIFHYNKELVFCQSKWKMHLSKFDRHIHDLSLFAVHHDQVLEMFVHLNNYFVNQSKCPAILLDILEESL